jgi:hypothetical protein
MSIQYNLTHRNNSMSDLNTLVGTNAVIKIFDGTEPATCNVADAGTTLVTFAGNSTAFGAVASGTLTVNAIASANVSTSGTPQYFRVYPSSANTTNAVIQGTVGTTGSGKDMIISSSPLTASSSVTITSWTITAYGA